jgi:hypothetical protein
LFLAPTALPNPSAHQQSLDPSPVSGGRIIPSLLAIQACLAGWPDKAADILSLYQNNADFYEMDLAL